MTDHISITRHDKGVVLVRMNRLDKKNALTGDMYDAMRGVIENAATQGTRAVVFAGGPGVFTSGNDIGDFIARSGGGGASPAFQFIKALATVEVPMIAAIDGLAIGVGTTMVLHMDLAYASPRALFRMPFVDLGLVPEAGSSLLAPRILGQQGAFALLGLGEGFSAERAKAAGLIYEVVEEGALEASVLAAAGQIAAKPPEALKIARDLMRGSRDDLVARIGEESEHFRQRLKSDEARTALTAFMTRKKG